MAVPDGDGSEAACRAVPRHVLERLEIAILCQEQMGLHWEDEGSGIHYLQRVQLLALLREDSADYLAVRVLSTGATLRVRVDRIRNLPVPLK